MMCISGRKKKLGKQSTNLDISGWYLFPPNFPPFQNTINSLQTNQTIHFSPRSQKEACVVESIGEISVSIYPKSSPKVHPSLIPSNWTNDVILPRYSSFSESSMVHFRAIYLRHKLTYTLAGLLTRPLLVACFHNIGMNDRLLTFWCIIWLSSHHSLIDQSSILFPGLIRYLFLYIIQFQRSMENV